MLKPKLVGRSNEIERLIKLAKLASSGKGTLVFISGEAGIGKSRLAEEFSQTVGFRDFQFLVGRCIPGNPIPFLPFHEALGKHSNLKSSEKGIGLFGFLNIGKQETLPIQTDRETILFRTQSLLKQISETKPLILLIEDVHWADSISLQMLHFFARNADGFRVLMIATYRPEEVMAGVEGEQHPLLEILRVMRREKICEEISLSPLSTSDLQIALESILGGKIEPNFVEVIARESGGNPLFAEETLNMFNGEGALAQRNGVWMPIELSHMVIPSAVKEVILRRLNALPDSELNILELASVYGTVFNSEIIEGIFKVDRLDVLNDLENLVDEYQLLKLMNGNFNFKHELVKNAVYEQISMPRRRELHKRIADQLEKKGRMEGDCGLLSLHYYLSGMREKAIKYSIMAGDISRRQTAEVEALIFYERALSILGEDRAVAEDKLHTLESIGDCYLSLANYEKALQYYMKYEEIDTKGNIKASIQIKKGKCWMSYALGKGDLSLSRQMLQKAKSVPNLSDLDLAEIESFKALLHYFCGNFEKSCKHSLEAEKLFEGVGEQRRLTTQLCDHAAAELSCGRVNMAIQDLKRAEMINQQYQDTVCSWDISYTMGMAFFHNGSHTEALSCFNNLVGRSKKYSEYSQLIAIHQIASLMLASEGRLEEAYTEALNCFDAARFIDEAYERLRAYVILAHVLLRMGKNEEAGEKIGGIIKLQKSFDWSVPSQIHGLSEIVLAEHAATKGRWEECLLGFERGLSIISQGPYCYMYEGLVRRLYGELLVSVGEKLRGLEEYEKALWLFNKLGNKLQSKITEEKIMNVK